MPRCVLIQIKRLHDGSHLPTRKVYGDVAAHTRIYPASSWFYQGEILFELGRDREAVESLRTYRRRAGSDARYLQGLVAVSYPRSLYFEALALERLGEKDEARKVAGRLLHLWERADPDLPLLREARALGKRLGVTGRR